jgi:WD40 repeat protein
MPSSSAGASKIGKIGIIKSIDHQGEVNRARYLPQNPDIVATSGISGTVHLFKLSSFPEQASGVFEPTAVLRAHKKNGYGISWNPTLTGRLLSSSDDHTVALWDVGHGTRSVHATTVFHDHTDIVNDVSWHHLNGSMFGSVSDDRRILIYDTRDGPTSPILKREQAHEDAINSVAFSPHSQYLLATVSSDETVALWDIRNFNSQLQTMAGHDGSVTCLEWSPHADGVLATAGQDRRVIIWDIRHVGEEQTADDAEDGAPELLFMHGGHTSAVSDISWNPVVPWTLASVADDNIAHVWRPADSVLGLTSHKVADLDLE